MPDTNLKPIVNQRVWIVEQDNRKIGSLIRNDFDQNITFLSGGDRIKFKNLDQFMAEYHANLSDTVTNTPSQDSIKEVMGYPTTCMPFNSMFNLKHKVPVYTKHADSKSFFCAGYYVFDKKTVAFNPKLIKISKSSFAGPYKTLKEAFDHVC